jgi:hypothetical protein
MSYYYQYSYNLINVYPNYINNYKIKQLTEIIFKYFDSDARALNEATDFLIKTSHDFPSFAFKILVEGEEIDDIQTLEFYKGQLVKHWTMSPIVYEVSIQTQKRIDKCK